MTGHVKLQGASEQRVVSVVGSCTTSPAARAFMKTTALPDLRPTRVQVRYIVDDLAVLERGRRSAPKNSHGRAASCWPRHLGLRRTHPY